MPSAPIAPPCCAASSPRPTRKSCAFPSRGLAAWAGEREVRGEITLVVAGAPDPEPPAAADLATMVADREAAGLDRKAAMTEVARSAGVPRREVYDAVLAARAVENP